MSETIAQLLAEASRQIDADSARLDAELLLCHSIGQPRSYLFSWPQRCIEAAQQAQFQRLLQRRIQGEPIAYILGEQEFWSLPFAVTTDTLIPRPETELLVELALAQAPANQPVRIADLGTGSGCIAISLAHERPHWQITAVDKSRAALRVAKANADRLAASPVRLVESDWCAALADHHYDLIIANPPYIRSDDAHLHQGDVRFEPRSALTAGADGLEDIRIICAQAGDKLKPGGQLLLEFGYDQIDSVVEIISANGFSDIQRHRDLAGINRATSATYCGESESG